MKKTIHSTKISVQRSQSLISMSSKIEENNIVLKVEIRDLNYFPFLLQPKNDNFVWIFRIEAL